MIDIHSHILPGLDDGAKTIQDSIAMAQEAYEDGIRTIIATPHHKNGVFNNPSEIVIEKVKELNLALSERGINVRILPGSEVRAYGEMVEDLKQGKLLTFNQNNRYIFLELPFDHVPKFVEQLVFDIQLAGYVPIIPHPERNSAFRENPIMLYHLIKRGALSQITACSLKGEFGKKIQKFSFELIEHNLIHLVATDAHGTGRRGEVLTEAYQLIEKTSGAGITRLFQSNAQAVMEGKDMWTTEPEKVIRKKILGII